jgi:hypothetical protein
MNALWAFPGYEGSPCGIPRGEYTAKPNLPDLGLRRLLFLKLTLMVQVP